MSHLDEGTLHALLDGELELDEVREIQQHLGTCAACGARLQDVKQFLAESDRLVGVLEVPAGKHAQAHDPRAPEQGSPRQQPSNLQSRRSEFPEPPAWEEPPPVLLLPDSPEDEARRGRWMRRLGLAAMIVVIVIGGRMISNALRPGKPELQITERNPAPQPATPPAVVSRQEQTRADAPAPGIAQQTRPPAAAKPPAPRPAAEPKALADQATTDSVADQFDSAQQFDSTAAIASDDTTPADEAVVASAAREDETDGQSADVARR
jgi:Putative zinc-finger